MSDDARAKIERRLQELGNGEHHWAWLAAEIGTGKSLLNKWKHGHVKRLGVRKAARICRLLNAIEPAPEHPLTMADFGYPEVAVAEPATA